MKKAVFVLLAVFAVAGFAMAQIGTVTTDSLGAHLNYGRGCSACHAPHSGVYGNGAAKTAYANAGVHALWGQDLGSLVGQTLQFGDATGGWTETLVGLDSTGVDRNITECLSCHDGNLATGAMMKNAVYEPLPPTYGGYNTIPTLLGRDGTASGNYLNDHPVGLKATIDCTEWDCVVVNGKPQMTGTNSAKFYQNYGFFVNLGNNAGVATVTCTTCHHQHVQNISVVTNGLQSAKGNSGLPSGTYLTMFFVRGPYNPANTNPGSNQTAQFCRQCHGGDANEMNGSSMGTQF